MRVPRSLSRLSSGLLPARKSIGLCVAHQHGNCTAQSGFSPHSASLPSRRHLSSNSLPYILQPSFWRSLLPKYVRSKSVAVSDEPKRKKKDWNPATFFIAMTVLIGSQAIQMIALRKDFDKFSNQTEARLATLREVVRRIQNGEDVDVAGMLGTGDPQAEKDWEEVIRELEEEDLTHRRRRKRSKATQAAQQEVTAAQELMDRNSEDKTSDKQT